jgi:hypothetical protein
MDGRSSRISYSSLLRLHPPSHLRHRLPASPHSSLADVSLLHSLRHAVASGLKYSRRTSDPLCAPYPCQLARPLLHLFRQSFPHVSQFHWPSTMEHLTISCLSPCIPFPSLLLLISPISPSLSCLQVVLTPGSLVGRIPDSWALVLYLQIL